MTWTLYDTSELSSTDAICGVSVKWSCSRPAERRTAERRAQPHSTVVVQSHGWRYRKEVRPTITAVSVSLCLYVSLCLSVSRLV